MDLSDAQLDLIIRALRTHARDRDDAANRMISKTRYHQEMAEAQAARELALQMEED